MTSIIQIKLSNIELLLQLIIKCVWSFLFKTYLKIQGFTYTQGLPEGVNKCVIVCAPHTSNHDFPIAKAGFYLLGIKVKFLAKKELLKWPFRKLFIRWGAISVDRNQKNHLVDYLAELFASNKNFALALAPEGTRKAVSTWKSGFYHIAKKANVPIALGFIDFKNKTMGIGKTIDSSQDYEVVLSVIKEFYRDIKPKFPENFEKDFS